MHDRIADAFRGWIAWNTESKIMGVFLAVLVFLWFGNAVHRKGAMGCFLRYASVFTVLCIFPVTAAILLLYQTRFYAYHWLFALLPITLLVAYGLTILIWQIVLTCQGASRKDKAKGALFVFLLGAALFFCIHAGSSVSEVEKTSDQVAEVKSLLQEIKAVMGEQTICLWAPKEILEYARAVDGEITLFYGRNMWNPYLEAYTYDREESKKEYYLWMEQVESECPKEQDAICRMIDSAKKQGVNCLLLPAERGIQLAALEEALGQQAQTVGSYKLFLFLEKER